jgi:glycerophosphoryl diester phosphodiesterase
MKDGFRLIAHRGASAHAPENTLAAFEKALAMGAREVELDVRLSADDRVVVFHDDRLDPKTPLEGRVKHYDLALLERADLAPWFERTHPDEPVALGETCIPRLETVFERLGQQVHYHVELKGWDALLPLRVMRLVDAYGLEGHVTLTSFSMRPLLEIRKLDPAVPITFLLRDAADALRSAEFRPELEQRSLAEVHDYWITTAAEAGFQLVGVRAADLREETVRQARVRGLSVRAWGIRHESDLLHAVQCGAIGATVDWPARARGILARSRRAS